MADLAPAIWGIPVVSGSSERTALFPVPTTDQRVFNKTTVAIERWNGAAWITDFQTGVAPGGARTVPDVTSYLKNNAIFNVLDYAVLANRDAIYAGTSDATPCTNAAIVAARLVGGIVVWPVGGRWRFDSPIDLTFAAGDSVLVKRPIWLRNEGNTGLGPVTDVSSANMIINHNGHGFDCAGSYDLIFENINGTNGVGKTPLTLFFCARNSVGSGAGHHAFINCKAYGAFSDSVYYGYGSEQNSADQNTYWVNTFAGGCVVTITGYNIRARTSSFIAIAAGAQSNTVSRFRGNYNSFNAGGHVFYLDACSDLVIDAWLFSGSGAADGHCLVHVDGTNAGSTYCNFLAVSGENGTFLPQYGYFFTNHAITHSFFTFLATRTATRTRSLFSGALATLANFQIQQFAEVGTPTGVEIQGILQDSYVRMDRTLIIGTEIRCMLIGDPTNWTITNRTRGVHINPTLGVFDGVGVKFWTTLPSADPNTLDFYEEGTWSPTLGGATSESGQTYGTRAGSYVKVGRKVTLTFCVLLTVPGVITGASVIKGLPFVNSNGSGFRAGLSLGSFDTLGIAVVELHGYLESNTSQIVMAHRIAASATETPSPNTLFQSGTSFLIGSISYIAAS